MRGNYSAVDARSVRCSCYDSRKGLVRNRAEVGHGEAHGAQSVVEFVECNTGLGENETFVSVDLFVGGKYEKGIVGGKRAVSGSCLTYI